MGSFQEDFYLETSSPLRHFWRNVRLVGYILQIVWFWGWSGARVRRALRRARRTGEPYIIDSLGGPSP
jgi:hypothetical protein